MSPVSLAPITPQLFQLVAVAAAQRQDRLQRLHGRFRDTILAQLRIDRFDPDLFEFVDCYGDIHHLVGMADRLGDPVKNFAVVHLQRYRDSQFGKDFFDDFDQFDLVDQAAAADHIDVALVKLPVASFLRPVGAPNRLNLITFEWK